MSGHSKWATTHRAKGVSDAKRALRFTKLARAITIAARGGANPETNFKLRLAVDQARGINMPKDNIERAIARGFGTGSGEQLEAVTYEGFGPHGVTVIIECLTDNKNRTSQELRHLVEEAGGGIGAPGSVSWQFARTGILRVQTLNDDDELAVIDHGVSDVQRGATECLLLCPPAAVKAVSDCLHQRGLTPQTGVTLLPKETVSLPDAAAKTTVQEFLARLENHADVQSVYHNSALV